MSEHYVACLDLRARSCLVVGEGAIETEKVETEIAAGSSGTVHWTAEIGVVYAIGAEIGLIRGD